MGNNHTILISYSGGLDSFLMWKYAEKHYPGSEIIRVYCDIGHDYSWKEKEVLDEGVIVEDLTSFKASAVSKDANNSGSIFIPGRNLLFVTYLACKYLPDEIWLGALKGEDHTLATDKNKMFRELASITLSFVLSPFKKQVEVVFPFVDANMGKFEITEWGVKEGYAQEILDSSSCMSSEQGNCGTCVVCVRRAGIFKQLGLYEAYNVNPFEYVGHYPMFIELLENNGHYDQYRQRELVAPLLDYWNMNRENLISFFKKELSLT